LTRLKIVDINDIELFYFVTQVKDDSENNNFHNVPNALKICIKFSSALTKKLIDDGGYLSDTPKNKMYLIKNTLMSLGDKKE
jgi:hypothetical protein